MKCGHEIKGGSTCGRAQQYRTQYDAAGCHAPGTGNAAAGTSDNNRRGTSTTPSEACTPSPNRKSIQNPIQPLQDLLGTLNPERALILGLLFLLAKEGADIKLLAALGYVLM